jgi:hypothetical protein
MKKSIRRLEQCGRVLSKRSGLDESPSAAHGDQRGCLWRFMGHAIPVRK